MKARQDLALKDSTNKFASADPEFDLQRAREFIQKNPQATLKDLSDDQVENYLSKLKNVDTVGGGQSTRNVLDPYSPKKSYGEMFREDFLPDVKSGIKNIVGAPFSENLTFSEGLSRLGSAAKGAPFTTAALGLGALGATGYFTPAAPSPYDLYGIDMRRGYDLYNKNPTQYMVPIPRPAIQYADGGIAQNFPRKSGAINGPGTGTSDDIPAMLSDGEFVFTAKAVRNAGGGDRKKGANKMYSMMKSLERMG